MPNATITRWLYVGDLVGMLPSGVKISQSRETDKKSYLPTGCQPNWTRKLETETMADTSPDKGYVIFLATFWAKISQDFAIATPTKQRGMKHVARKSRANSWPS